MDDSVNHPKHYTGVVPGVECIEVTKHFSFLRGNAIKYLWRQGLKGAAAQDLAKAIWYINRELDMMSVERWATWPEDNRYQVSSLGNVRRVGAERNRKPVRIKNGYLTIGRTVGGKPKVTYVHRMVAETFLRYPIPPDQQVCHNDGSRDNCELSNLRLDTAQGNARDRRRHGTHYVGERNPSAVLTAEQAEAIRLTTGSEHSVAKAFGVSGSTVGRIRRGQAHADHRTPLDRLLDAAEAHFQGDVGSALALLWRAGAKGKSKTRQDLQKAMWYIQCEIDTIQSDRPPPCVFKVGDRVKINWRGAIHHSHVGTVLEIDIDGQMCKVSRLPVAGYIDQWWPTEHLEIV